MNYRKLIEVVNTVIVFFGLNLFWTHYITGAQVADNLVKNIQSTARDISGGRSYWILSNLIMIITLYLTVLIHPSGSWMTAYEDNLKKKTKKKGFEYKRYLKLLAGTFLGLAFMGVHTLNNASLFTKWRGKKIIILNILGGILVFSITTFITIILEKPEDGWDTKSCKKANPPWWCKLGGINSNVNAETT